MASPRIPAIKAIGARIHINLPIVTKIGRSICFPSLINQTPPNSMTIGFPMVMISITVFGLILDFSLSPSLWVKIYDSKNHTKRH
jgi:hypothetical protein